MLSLPLAKLSTATNDSVDGKKLIWKHDTQNLIFVIDTYGARGVPSQLIKVVQGTQVLVREQNLDILTTPLRHMALANSCL